MTDQLNVNPAVLVQAAKGIEGTIGGLSEMGIGETGNMGRGFSLLTLSTKAAGKHSVQKAFEEFTERWSWGVRALVQAGNAIARTLGLAAGRYHEMDQKGHDTLKKMWTHMAGNPHLTDEQITKRSWRETFADNSFNHIRNADYSAKSFQDANRTIQTNMKIVGEVGPQALANVNPASGLITGERPGWNTGASQRAAEIMKESGGQ
ncbi:type VII secretion target [Nocardia sp. CDC159]|uniref:Type VII secretion target n=1 Tax=Nocardia pulmonis TaxID=2951408 RepID=A0A9X2E5P2_9NOCA|nr:MULTISPECIES: type VII secretion target [Nocardia]MCM6774111.1 type VII secretion target [Nocardia pulmonis]MCM6786998.1 type VII secretion target [Nocardia sp. CDC159]